jgi:hypothetical protein
MHLMQHQGMSFTGRRAEQVWNTTGAAPAGSGG